MPGIFKSRVFPIVIVLWGILFCAKVYPGERVDLAAYNSQPHWLRTGHKCMWSILTGDHVAITYQAKIDREMDYIVVFGVSESVTL